MQDDISLDYDPAHNRDYWQRRPVAVVQRGMQIAGAFGVWFLRGKLQSQRFGAADSNARLQAEQLRHILTRLGPAFVKIGQVSSRSCNITSTAALMNMQLCSLCRLCRRISCLHLVAPLLIRCCDQTGGVLAAGRGAAAVPQGAREAAGPDPAVPK